MSRDRVALLLRLREYGWDHEEWFVPLAAALDGVGPAEASWQPPGGGNSIWQTLNHLNYYNERILFRLTGRKAEPGLPNNDATFGEPGNLDDTAGWQSALQRSRQIAEALHEALSERSDADLDTPVVETAKAALGQELLPWLMHDAYHTGQIVLIRKQQGSWPAHRG